MYFQIHKLYSYNVVKRPKLTQMLHLTESLQEMLGS